MKQIYFFRLMLISALLGFCVISASAQRLKVDATGTTFRVNNVLAGYTGSSSSTSSVFFGYGALKSGASTPGNVAIGANALATVSNSYADYNVAVGYNALYMNAMGYYSVAVGSYSLYSNTSGYRNSAVGHQALYSNKTGYNNVAVGHQALYSSTGNNNTALGTYTDVGNASLTNATALGYNAWVTASNQVRIGNSSISSIVLGNHTTIPSDGRTKRNIRSEVPGLAFIEQLQPIVYSYNLDALDELEKSDDPKISARRDSILDARSPEEKAIEAKARADKEKIVFSGFIAQDVEKAAQSIGYNFNGVDAPENGKGPYGLRYSEFVVPLVKAVQELSEQNNAKDVVIASLQEQINELKANSSLRSTTNEMETTGAVDAVVAQCKLYQNAPNPFGQDTRIKYYLPQEVKTAYLCIYDLRGTQIKQILIAQRGEGSQLILGSELAAGMYLYALIVDGKEVDTKRMIIQK